jgi:hypothetical protein
MTACTWLKAPSGLTGIWLPHAGRPSASGMVSANRHWIKVFHVQPRTVSAEWTRKHLDTLILIFSYKTGSKVTETDMA